MLNSLRFALVIGGLVVSTQLSASNDLTLVRSGAGLIGAPQQLSGIIDLNRNGRPELMVAASGLGIVSFVEEDVGPRGYREVARLNAPGSSYYLGALLIDVPGEDPALLLRWIDRLEVRNIPTLGLQATLSGYYDRNPALGDVDGDGLVDLVVARSSASHVDLFDPVSLAPRGRVPLPLGAIAVADIVGDERAEIISNDGRAYTVTRSGGTLTSTEVWNAGITGRWNPHVVEFDGHAAIVLHSEFGYSAQLATFRPLPSIRMLIPADGPSFTPLFADADGDGRVDLIAATSGRVRALDLASGATLWERDTIYQDPRIGSVYQPVAYDLDGDGTVELIWADASYNSGVVANTLPLTGAPRWRSDARQAHVADWTLVRRTGSTPTIAYLTYGTWEMQGLGTLGFLNGSTFLDQAGSAFSWLPGYLGNGRTLQQSAITSLSLNGIEDVVVVGGADYPQAGGDPVARWLWTFDGNGAYLSARSANSSTNMQRIAAAQVLARPERQIVVAGGIPRPVSGPYVPRARIEIVDYATGVTLWQSVPLPTYDGASVSKLEVADLDADGQLDIVVAYGGGVAIFKPSTSSDVVAEFAAQDFSLLNRGDGRRAKFATLRGTDVAVYDGMSSTPEKSFVLPDAAYAISLFTQAPDDALMFATADYTGIEVRRYVDGEIVASSAGSPGGFLAAVDIDRDNRTEIVAASYYGFSISRFGNDHVFRDGFERLR